MKRSGTRALRRLVPALVLGLLASGCVATGPYVYGQGLEGPDTLRLRDGEPQLERGRPNALLDTLGNVVALPGKLLLLDWRVDNHDVGPETETAIEQYLADNGLHNVKVRINQYAPGAEWSRLARNDAVGPGWRWTLGMIGMLSYTVLPGRVFGGDHYNPYTNTIHLYSDLPAIALHEAGHAKDFAESGAKGSYAALRVLPLVPLWQEAEATGDAISYARERASPAVEKQAYRTLYPAYGTYVGGEAARWVGGGWVGYAVQYGTVIPGHIAGWIQSLFVDASRPPAPSPVAAPPPAAPAPAAAPTRSPEDDAEPL